MKEAGKYNRLCEWAQFSLGAKDTFGGKPYVLTVQSNVWVQIEEPTASDAEMGKSKVQHSRTTIRVRGWSVGIKAFDTLRDLQFDETWIVETVVRGDNELVCNASRRSDDEYMI